MPRTKLQQKVIDQYGIPATCIDQAFWTKDDSYWETVLEKLALTERFSDKLYRETWELWQFTAFVGSQTNFQRLESDMLFESSERITPVHYASLSGKLDFLQYLIEQKNYDPFSPTIGDNLPIHYAVIVNDIDITRYLSEKDPKTRWSKNLKGKTPIHIALYLGHLELVEMLLPQNNKIQRETLAFSAIKSKKENMIDLFIERTAFDAEGPFTHNDLLKLALAHGSYEITSHIQTTLNLELPQDALIIAAKNPDISNLRGFFDAEQEPELAREILFSAMGAGNLAAVKFLIEEAPQEYDISLVWKYARSQCPIGECNTYCMNIEAVEASHAKHLYDKIKNNPDDATIQRAIPYKAYLFDLLIQEDLEILKEAVSKDDAGHPNTALSKVFLAKRPITDSRRGIAKQIYAEIKKREACPAKEILRKEFAVSREVLDNPIWEELTPDWNKILEICQTSNLSILWGSTTSYPLKAVNIVEFVLLTGDLTTFERCEKSYPNLINAYSIRLAAFSGNIALMQHIRKEHPDLPLMGYDKSTANTVCSLSAAASNNKPDMLMYLATEIDATKITSLKQARFSPLHRAARDGALEAVKCLINELQFNPTTPTNLGETLLHLAAKNGNTQLIDYLLMEHPEIDLLARDNKGRLFCEMPSKASQYCVQKFAQHLFQKLSTQTEPLDEDSVTRFSQYKDELYTELMKNASLETLEEAIRIDETGQPNTPLSQVFHAQRSISPQIATVERIKKTLWDRKAAQLALRESAFAEAAPIPQTIESVLRDLGPTTTDHGAAGLTAVIAAGLSRQEIRTYEQQQREKAEAEELFKRLQGKTDAKELDIQRAGKLKDALYDRLVIEVEKLRDNPNREEGRKQALALIDEALNLGEDQTSLSIAFHIKRPHIKGSGTIAKIKNLRERVRLTRANEILQLLRNEENFDTYTSNHPIIQEASEWAMAKELCQYLTLASEKDPYGTGFRLLEKCIATKRDEKSHIVSKFPLGLVFENHQELTHPIRQIVLDRRPTFLYNTLRDFGRKHPLCDHHEQFITKSVECKDQLFDALRKDLDSKSNDAERRALIEHALDAKSPLGQAFARKRKVIPGAGGILKELKKLEKKYRSHPVAAPAPVDDGVRSIHSKL